MYFIKCISYFFGSIKKFLIPPTEMFICHRKSQQNTTAAHFEFINVEVALIKASV